MKKLFFLAAAVLVCAGVWAVDLVLVDSIDFTNTTNFPAKTYTGEKATVNGVFFNAKSSKNIKVNNTTPGIDFDSTNGDASSHNIGIPVTGVNGTLKVIVYHDCNTTSASFKVGISHADGNDPAKSQSWDLSVTNSGTKNKNEFIITKTDLTGTDYIVWAMETSSSYKVIKRVAIYTEAPSAIAPAITAPTTDQEAEYTVGDAIAALEVTATGAPAPTYKWYSNATKSTEGAEEIDGATEASYTPSNAAVSDLYYYCVASNASGSATSPYFHVSVAAAPTFDVTYATDKGEAPAAQPSVTSVELPQIAAVEGFIHTAWTANVATKVAGETVAAGTEIAIGTTVFVSAATTFTAVWTPTVTITLNPVGGASEDVAGWTLTAGKYSKTVASGAEVALPVFTKAERTFKTWRNASTDADVTSPVTVNANIELNAVWTKTLETVIYSWEGAEGGAIEVGGTATSSTNGGSSFDNAQINVAQANYYCLQLNGKDDYSTNIVQIDFEQAIVAGDTIRYIGFYNNAKTKNAAPKMRDGNSGNAAIFTGSNLPNITTSDAGSYSYVVPAGINTNKVQLTRAQTQSSSFLTKLVITRNVPVEEGDLVTVTFDAAGGSNVDAIDLVKGEKVAEPTAPTKDGYDFDGWYLAGNLYDFDAAVNSNIELVAKWVVAATKYTVTYKHGEAVLGTEEVEEGNAPAQYTTAQTKVNLATFVGWYDNNELTGDAIDLSAATITEDITFYAKFTYKYATSINIEQAVLDNSKKFNLLNALGAKNYATNWTNDLDSLTEEKANTDRNYPYLGEKVKAAGKMIDFRLAQGSIVKVKFGNVPDDVKVVINGVENTITKATLANPYEYNATEDTYMSIRSTTGNTLVFKQIMIDEDIQTVVLPALYTVTYDAGEGECAVASDFVEFASEKITLPAATPTEGYRFIGWYNATTEGTKVGIAEDKITLTKDSTLYAQYAQIYTITCNKAEYGTVAANPTTAIAGEEVSLTITPAEGYVLNVLSVEDALDKDVTVENGKFTMPASNVTVSATFQTIPSSINNTDAAVQTVKVIRNGQLIIIRDGKEFNVLGAAVK